MLDCQKPVYLKVSNSENMFMSRSVSAMHPCGWPLFMHSGFFMGVQQRGIPAGDSGGYHNRHTTSQNNLFVYLYVYVLFDMVVFLFRRYSCVFIVLYPRRCSGKRDVNRRCGTISKDSISVNLVLRKLTIVFRKFFLISKFNKFTNFATQGRKLFKKSIFKHQPSQDSSFPCSLPLDNISFKSCSLVCISQLSFRRRSYCFFAGIFSLHQLLFIQNHIAFHCVIYLQVSVEHLPHYPVQRASS